MQNHMCLMEMNLIELVPYMFSNSLNLCSLHESSLRPELPPPGPYLHF